MAIALAVGCDKGRSAPADAAASATQTALEADAAAPDAAAPDAAPADAGASPDAAALPGRTDGCPGRMVRIEGEYCPGAMEPCIEHHPEWVHNAGRKGVAERCLRYREPSRCLSKRVHSDFCMDRWEYPNEPGELPWVLTSWRDAREICEGQGKRLCTEAEFHFACEGPDLLPYVYGYVRDPKICNQDRDYVVPDHSHKLLHYADCQKDESCAAELHRLDQRERIGQRTSCVSWAGVFDLNGNVNEWVVRPNEKAPHRSGLMGGWWGPIRSRCRAITTFHPEEDYGYEVGFRCCADVGSGAAR